MSFFYNYSEPSVQSRHELILSKRRTFLIPPRLLSMKYDKVPYDEEKLIDIKLLVRPHLGNIKYGDSNKLVRFTFS